MLAELTSLLIFLSLRAPLTVGELPRPYARRDTLRLAQEAVGSVLASASCTQSSVTLVTDGTTSATTVFQTLDHLRIASGVGVLEVAAYAQDGNITEEQLSLAVGKALQLQRMSWCMTVVVVSDDPAFLAAFAQWSLKGLLLQWSTRLLAVTRLPLRRLHHLHETFSMTNSMMLIVYESSISTSCSVYIHLPYSDWRTQALHIAYWTPRKGVVLITDYLLFPEKFTKLHYGPNFVIAAEEFEPHTLLVRDEAGQAAGAQEALFYGPMVNLLHMLGQDMNFTFSFMRPPDGSWGYEKPDGSFSGMVGMLLRNEAVIGLGPFAYSAARSKVIDYTRPMLIDYIRIMGGRGRPEVDPWGFLLPLAPLVWAAILTTLLLVPAGMVLLLSCSLLHTDSKTTDIFFGYLRVLLQQDYLVSADWLWKRLVVGVWMVTTLVLTRSYAGNLMSLLAVRHIPQPYQSLRDVLDDSRATMIWEANSIYMKFAHLAESGTFREVADKDNEGLIHYLKTTEFSQAVDTLVRWGHHVLVVEALTLEFRMAQDFSNTGRCDFYLSKEVFLPFMFCMIGQKKSPLVPVISNRIRTMTEAGLYDYWQKSTVPNSTSCLHPPTKITVQTTLALTNLWGMFVVLVGGHASGLLVLFLEVFNAKLLQS